MDASACMDAKADDVGVKDAANQTPAQKCAQHVNWAMGTGIKQHADWYKNYTVGGAKIDNTASFQVFQCLEWLKTTHEQSTDGHGCRQPCAVAAVVFNGDTYCTGTTTPVPAETSEPKKGGGFPWWAWLLIALGALAVIGGLAYAFWPAKKAPKKKKRAVKAPPVEEPPAATPTPVATTAVPMPTYAYTAPPVYVQAAPTTVQYAAPASVSYAAPVTTVAAPMTTYAAPQVTLASSVQYAGVAQTAQTAFDMIDSNHDGVISRQELTAGLR